MTKILPIDPTWADLIEGDAVEHIDPYGQKITWALRDNPTPNPDIPGYLLLPMRDGEDFTITEPADRHLRHAIRKFARVSPSPARPTPADLLLGAITVLSDRGRLRDGWYLDPFNGNVCAVAAVVIAAGFTPEHKDTLPGLDNPVVIDAMAAIVDHLKLPRTHLEEDEGVDDPASYRGRVANWSDTQPDDQAVINGLRGAADAWTAAHS